MPSLITDFLDLVVGRCFSTTSNDLLANPFDFDHYSHRQLGGSADGDDGSIEHFYFEDVIFAFLFVTAVFIGGGLFHYMSLPSLIGEIIVGTIAGPLFVDFVPEYLAFMLLGGLNLDRFFVIIAATTIFSIILPLSSITIHMQ